MDFKNWFCVNEAIENLLQNAEELGSIPRKEIQKWISASSFQDSYSKRRIFNTLFGWSVPCKEAVDKIKKHATGSVYDVMAGTGYWGRILKKAGVNVKISDLHKVFGKNNYHKYDKDSEINIKPEKIKIRRKNALRIGYDLSINRLKGDVFLSWPPYECPVATDILNMAPTGTKLFYIGEGQGGCTGDLSFHKTLSTNFKLIDQEELPTFEGIHDYLAIYQKIKNDNLDPKYRGKSFDWDLE